MTTNHIRRRRRSPACSPARNGFDQAVATGALFVFAPLLAVVAIAIRLDSPGPVFYRQLRVGLGGRYFRIFKFRTMVVGAEKIGLRMSASVDDDRITRVGSWLRRTSLDELPQLFNIARGEMSVIGPRPTLPEQVVRYSPQQCRRLECKPGITGWAQVNGRNDLTWEERIAHDIWYVDHWSPLLDLLILLRTPRAMLDPRGIYGSSGRTRDLGER